MVNFLTCIAIEGTKDMDLAMTGRLIYMVIWGMLIGGWMGVNRIANMGHIFY